MKTVFLLLDAFRHDYVSRENTPFLWNCAENGTWIQHVVPSYGFCERTEILTGQKPDESGFFTAIGFAPDNSPFKDIKFLKTAGILEPRIPAQIRIPLTSKSLHPRRKFRRMVSRYALRRHKTKMLPYQIPFAFLPFFDLTEDKLDHRNINAFSSPSVLQMLEEQGIKYFYDSFTALGLPPNGSDDDRLRLALNNAENENTGLYLIYLSETDHYGHSLGPDAPEFKALIRDLDSRLEVFTTGFSDRADEDTRFIFLGDHGMCKVTGTIDAGSEILSAAKKLGLMPRKDFIYFLDSTMVRLWIMSEKAAQGLPDAIRRSPPFNENGIFADDDFAAKYHLPWPDRRYGDILWCANQGVLVSPDFFHDRGDVSRGMHGYAPEYPESHGMCIVHQPGITTKNVISQADLTDIFDFFKQ